jgi:hypothetical protein
MLFVIDNAYIFKYNDCVTKSTQRREILVLNLNFLFWTDKDLRRSISPKDLISL